MTLLNSSRSVLRRVRQRVRAALRLHGRRWTPAHPKTMSDARIATYESLTLSVLTDSGPLPLAGLIDRVAERSRQLDAVGSVPDTDVGVWGSQVYRHEAQDAVRSLLGRSLALEIDGPWVLVSPAPRAKSEGCRTRDAATEG